MTTSNTCPQCGAERSTSESTCAACGYFVPAVASSKPGGASSGGREVAIFWIVGGLFVTIVMLGGLLLIPLILD